MHKDNQEFQYETIVIALLTSYFGTEGEENEWMNYQRYLTDRRPLINAFLEKNAKPQ